MSREGVDASSLAATRPRRGGRGSPSPGTRERSGPATPATESAASPAHLVVFLLVQTAVVGLALVEAGDRIAQWRLSDRLARLAGALTAAPSPGLAGRRTPGRRCTTRPPGPVPGTRPRGARGRGRPGRRPPADSPDGTPTAVGRRGQQVALVVHSTHVDGERLDRALGAALRLVLENEQLRAATLAELAELAGPENRIVERAELERRRLERNLHDGAQQRVVSLALHGADAGGRAARRPAGAGVRAESLTRSTVEELRRVARGIYPAVLTDSGLPARCTTSPSLHRPRGASWTAFPTGATPVPWRRPPTSSSPRRWPMRAVAERRRRTVCGAEQNPSSSSRCATTPPPGPAPGYRPHRPGPRVGRHVVVITGTAAGRRPAGAAVRVVIADDAVLIRSGVATLLAESGVEIVGQAGDARRIAALLVARTRPRCGRRRHPHAAHAHRRGLTPPQPIRARAPGRRRPRALPVPRRGLRAAPGRGEPGRRRLPAQGPDRPRGHPGRRAAPVVAGECVVDPDHRAPAPVPGPPSKPARTT